MWFVGVVRGCICFPLTQLYTLTGNIAKGVYVGGAIVQ